MDDENLMLKSIKVAAADQNDAKIGC